MGRIRRNIKVNGKQYWTLFDSGSRNTYVTHAVTEGLPVFKFKINEPVKLGGQVHNVTEYCRMEAFIDEYPVRVQARVLDNIGSDEEGKQIEILFGALAMQEWGIKLDVPHETLDMTHFSKEFIEFKNIIL